VVEGITVKRKVQPIKMNGMMLTTSPGMGDITDILTKTQGLSTAAAIAFGGAVVMGVGTVIPGKFGWGFKLLGLAGMGFGGYKLYEALSGETGADGGVSSPPINPKKAEIIASGGQATQTGTTPDSTVGKAAAVIAGTKGGTGEYYQAAMDAKARYKSGYEDKWSYNKTEDLKHMRLWYDEIKYNTDWTTTAEFQEVKQILTDEGELGIVENAFMFVTDPVRKVLGSFDLGAFFGF
jgi:hypothetical protein